jgi:hypothetical protein
VGGLVWDETPGVGRQNPTGGYIRGYTQHGKVGIGWERKTYANKVGELDSCLHRNDKGNAGMTVGFVYSYAVKRKIL